MIVDIHTHAFPDNLAPRAMKTLSGRAAIPAHTDGTCAGLLAASRRAGVDVAVVLPIATRPSQVRPANAWAEEVNQGPPGILCLGTLHPGDADWPAEVRRLKDAGIPGVKLHPDYQDFFLDDPVMLPIYRALADAGLLLLLHSGVDIGLPPPVHCTPERLARVLDAVPGLTVIASHMGAYQQWDEVERWLVGRNLYLDTSYSLADMGLERMAALLRAHGPERVLFGSDAPWRDQSAELNGLRALGLTPCEERAVLGGNALRLIPGLRRRAA